MSTILVTGAYGQLGSELKALSVRWPEMDFLFTDYDTLDITDQEAVCAFISGKRPDFLINCAAYTAVDKAENDRDNAMRLNGLAPGILAGSCQIHGTRMIHISTDYVFNGTGCLPYAEDDRVDPVSVYGRTKLEGEKMALKNQDMIVIRTSWLYSSFGQNFVKTMIRLGRERETLKVVFDQAGTPTYARDLADAILSIISQASSDREKWIPGIYHYSNEGVCSWYDFALAVHELAGITCQVIPVTSEEFPSPVSRPHFSVLNKTKIKRTFGIDIPHWRQSLNSCISLIKTS